MICSPATVAMSGYLPCAFPNIFFGGPANPPRMIASIELVWASPDTLHEPSGVSTLHRWLIIARDLQEIPRVKPDAEAGTDAVTGFYKEVAVMTNKASSCGSSGGILERDAVNTRDWQCLQYATKVGPPSTFKTIHNGEPEPAHKPTGTPRLRLRYMKATLLEGNMKHPSS